MSRRFPVLVCLLCLIFSLVQCGSSNEPQGSMGKLPGSWAKYLAIGTITASLDVYQEDGDKELSLELSIDSETGTVSAEPFKLVLGNNYRFIIVFHYAVSTQASIPYAYADFTHLIDEFSEAVSFNENDIRYGLNVEDPNISTDLSRGILPDLDLDRDGWSNWEELRDKVDPQDSSSVPIVPTVDVKGAQDGNSTTATITIIAKDNAHVEKLKLADPLCGATVISDTQQTNVDGSVTRTLIVKLDLLSVSKNSRPIQAVADDGVTPSQDDNEVLQFNLSGSASQPYFVFTEPEENSEVEGATVFRGIACSRQEINVNSAQFLNAEIAQFQWTGARNELNGDYILESDPVATELLPDGPNLLKVEVSDGSNKTGDGGRTYLVTNDSQLKVIDPVGRRWIFGNEQIAVSVKDLPDSNIVIAETEGDFNLKSSTAGGLVGVLDVSNLEDGTVIPITFKAVRGDGSEVTRAVNFTVRNRPQIEVFPKASKVFSGWSTDLLFRIVNVQPELIHLLDGLNAIAPNHVDCAEDNLAAGITVCSGSFPAKVTQNKSFKLTAERSATAGELCVNCTDEKSTALTLLGTLPEDLPEINAAIDGDDEPVAPSRIRMPVESPTKYYRYFVQKAKNGEIDFQDELSSGETAVVGGLEALTDYREVLQILSSVGGNVDSEMYKDVTTGEIGLIGWWRFNKDPFKADCPGEDSTFSICDYSGRGSHGDPSGELAWLQSSAEFFNGALAFNGLNGKVIIPDSISEPIDEITISCLIKPQPTSGHVSIFTNDAVDAGFSGPGTFNLNQTSDNNIYFSANSDTWIAAFGLMGDLVNTKFRATGTYQLGAIKLFFDGQLQDQDSITNYLPDHTRPFRIGWHPYFNDYFSGVIGDCLMFKRALTVEQIINIPK